MPAKSELFIQPEVGALGLREARRSDSSICRSGQGAGAASRPGNRVRGTGANSSLRSARGSNCENINPNIGTGANGRRSPRLRACSGNGGSLRAFGGSRGGALSDITNVAAGRASQVDKVKPLKRQPSHHSLQPLAVAVLESEVSAIETPVEEKDATQKQDAETANPQNAHEYALDIHNQLFQNESTFSPQSDYMDMQSDLREQMRTILVDWLIEVHMKYKLRPETLHLTVNLIDRYLTKVVITKSRLQLLGVAAMFIASKFEEINPPELSDLVYISDRAYTKDEILMMECSMLTTLSFRIMVPTAAHFFDVFQKANECDAVHRSIGQYLLELGLLDVRMLQFPPSHVVSAALLLSNELNKRSSVWPELMVQECHLSEQELQPCVDVLRQLLVADQAHSGGQLQAVHKKFAAAQRHGVSKMKF